MGWRGGGRGRERERVKVGERVSQCVNVPQEPCQLTDPNQNKRMKLWNQITPKNEKRQTNTSDYIDPLVTHKD